METVEKQSQYIFQLLSASQILEKVPNLETGLQEVASLAAQILKTDKCSIMLLESDCPLDAPEEANGVYLKVFTHYGNLPKAAYQQMTNLNEGIAGYVAATGKPLLIENIDRSEFAGVARYGDLSNKSLISAPIMLGEQVIGVINASNPQEKDVFDRKDLDLLDIFALFVGRSIHIAQMQNILNSRFVELAVARELADNPHNHLDRISPHPGKLSRIVAKSIFRELTLAGFGSKEIIRSATEILNLLQNNLEMKTK